MKVLLKFFSGTLKEGNREDKFAQYILRSFSLATLVIILLMVVLLIVTAFPSIRVNGMRLLTDSDWAPFQNKFGALSLIYGTVITSILALVISAPFCIALALYISEIAPKKFKFILSSMIEMLAAIPSIIYGMWALFVVAPFVKNTVYPLSQDWFPNISFFEGPSYGVGILTSSIVLAIMITPIITVITTETFKTIPVTLKQASLALGATKWEMFKISILKPSRSGIISAMILGLGRALGETMAVTMVIGNTPDIIFSIFATGATLSSMIANEYTEAIDSLHMASLTHLALALFIITFIINFIARYTLSKAKIA